MALALSSLLLTATAQLPTAGGSGAGSVRFGAPRLVHNSTGADGFYGVGTVSSAPRIAVGEHFASMDGGMTWPAAPAACATLPALDQAFIYEATPSHSNALTMRTFGRFAPKLKPGEQASNFTAATGQFDVSVGTGGDLSCAPSADGIAVKPGGPIRFVNLPPIISARFSKGGMRFGGAASVYLGGGGTHKYLQSVIVTLASDAESAGTSVLALGSADGKLWQYLAPIALAKDNPTSQEGPNEMDLAWLPDGKTILAMIRLDGGDGPKTHPYVNYHRSVSTDRGKSWSALTAVDAGCARPRLLQLGTTMLLSGGRRRNENTSDVILWAATDGTGEVWAAHSLSAAHNAGQTDPALRYDAKVNSSSYSPRETNSYTSLVALSAKTALVVYDMILHRHVNTTELSTECVSWPIPANHTKAGCEAGGDALHDGGTYHYNTGRGTGESVCAKQPHPGKSCRDGCDCCRTQPGMIELESYTFAMEVSL